MMNVGKNGTGKNGTRKNGTTGKVGKVAPIKMAPGRKQEKIIQVKEKEKQGT